MISDLSVADDLLNQVLRSLEFDPTYPSTNIRAATVHPHTHPSRPSRPSHERGERGELGVLFELPLNILVTWDLRVRLR